MSTMQKPNELLEQVARRAGAIYGIEGLQEQLDYMQQLMASRNLGRVTPSANGNGSSFVMDSLKAASFLKVYSTINRTPVIGIDAGQSHAYYEPADLSIDLAAAFVFASMEDSRAAGEALKTIDEHLDLNQRAKSGKGLECFKLEIKEPAYQHL